MKVFKFYSDDLFFACSGKDESESKQCLFEQMGEMTIDKVEEIPELKWDEKIINIWEDNNFENEPFKESIREQIVDNEPTIIYTNDISSF